MSRLFIAVLIVGLFLASPAAAQTGGASPDTSAPQVQPAPRPMDPAPAPPAADDDSVVAAKPSVVKKLQKKLAGLGFYTNGIDGIAGPFTMRAFCAFQLLTDSAGPDAPARLYYLPKEDRRLLNRITKDQLRMKMRNSKRFIRVSILCQTLFLVSGGKVKQIRPVSTGLKGTDSQGKPSYATPKGRFYIYRKFGRREISKLGPPDLKKVPGWDYSVEYENSPMYLPMYLFVNRPSGFAIHGMKNPADVAPIKASHGCIRMIKHHQYSIWSQVREGTPVWVT